MAVMRDRYLQASWRGVSFYIERDDIKAGRKVVLHEIPLRDKPAFDDLGRRPRAFSLEAYLIGDDADEQAKRWLTLCEDKSGVGKLRHPYLGEMDAVLMDMSVTMIDEYDRIIRLALDFEEATPLKFPLATISNSQTITNNVTAVQQQAITQATTQYTSTPLTTGVKQAVAGQTLTFAQQVQGLTSQGILSATGLQQVTDWATKLSAGANTLVDVPLSLFANVSGLMTSLRDGILPGASSVRRLLRLLQLFTDPSPQGRAMRFATETSVWSIAAETASVVSYDSYDEAMAIRGELARALTTVVSGLPEDGADLLNTLSDLHASTADEIRTLAAELPRIVRYQLGAPLPALVVAYNLYEDPDRADDLVRRNQAPDWLRLPTERQLEILAS